MKFVRLITLALSFLTLSGCDVSDQKLPLCSKGIPTYSELFQNPLFASLQYHKRTPYDYAISMGYDLWADSKFVYTSALQFNYVHKDETNINNCVSTDVLRMTLPLKENQKPILAAFSNQLIKTGGFDSKQIQKKLDDYLKHHTSYQPIAQKDNVIISAGVVRHPFRGDFFVVSAEAK